jgi:hypothetical protein
MEDDRVGENDWVHWKRRRSTAKRPTAHWIVMTEVKQKGTLNCNNTIAIIYIIFVTKIH